MALWKRLTLREPKKIGNHRTEVEAYYYVTQSKSNASNEEEIILHIYNLSSGDKGKGNHKRQCVEIDANVAKELFQLLKETFNLE